MTFCYNTQDTYIIRLFDWKMSKLTKIATIYGDNLWGAGCCMNDSSRVATRQCAAGVESVDHKWKTLISMLHVAAKKHSAVPLLITLPRCCYVLQSCLNVVVVNIGYDTWHISVAYFWCDGAVHCGWGRVHPAYSHRVLYQLLYHWYLHSTFCIGSALCWITSS